MKIGIKKKIQSTVITTLGNSVRNAPWPKEKKWSSKELKQHSHSLIKSYSSADLWWVFLKTNRTPSRDWDRTAVKTRRPHFLHFNQSFSATHPEFYSIPVSWQLTASEGMTTAPLAKEWVLPVSPGYSRGRSWYRKSLHNCWAEPFLSKSIYSHQLTF